MRKGLVERAARLIGIGVLRPTPRRGTEERAPDSLRKPGARWREVDLTTFFTEANGLPIFVENETLRRPRRR